MISENSPVQFLPAAGLFVFSRRISCQAAEQFISCGIIIAAENFTVCQDIQFTAGSADTAIQDTSAGESAVEEAAAPAEQPVLN